MKRVVAVVLALLLCACTAIPTEGPVERVTAAPAPAGTRGADIAPGPPVPGASADQLVAGFLVAMAAGQPGFMVARQYLTEAASEQWRPERNGVQVYDADGSPPISTADSARIDAPLLGRLDPSGRYSSIRGRISHDFGLVRVDNELRITNPPAGLLVSHYMFNRYFSSFPVYFFDRQQTLVPDLVHLSLSQVTPMEVLDSLMAGPSTNLAPGVVTAIPEGTRLRSATIDDTGIATVDLAGPLAALNDDERRRVGAQVAWALTNFPRVASVRIMLQGQPYPIPGQTSTGTLELVNLQGFQVLSGAQTTDLYALRDGNLGRVSDTGSFTPVGGTLGQVKSVGQFALSMDGQVVAAVDTAGHRLWVGATDGAVVNVDVGMTALRDPQVTRGATWILGRRADGSTGLERIDSTGRRVPVGLPDDLADITGFRVGPAGARVAVITGSAGQSRLRLATVVDDSATVTLAETVTIDPTLTTGSLTDFSAVAWGGETTLVVLAATQPGGARLAYQMNVDGTQALALGPAGETSLSSLSVLPRKSGLSVVATDEAGQVLRYDARWQVLPSTGLREYTHAG